MHRLSCCRWRTALTAVPGSENCAPHIRNGHGQTIRGHTSRPFLQLHILAPINGQVLFPLPTALQVLKICLNRKACRLSCSLYHSSVPGITVSPVQNISMVGTSLVSIVGGCQNHHSWPNATRRYSCYGF